MKIILDSCLLLAYFHKEKNWKEVKKYLLEAKRGRHDLFLCWINLIEVYYKIYRKKGEIEADKALSVIKQLPIRLIIPDQNLFIETARIKGAYSIAVADCFMVALAKQLKAGILTGDPEFKKIGKIVKIIWNSKIEVEPRI